MGRTMALQNLRPGLPQKTPPAWRVLHYGFCFALVRALLLFQAYYIGPCRCAAAPYRFKGGPCV